jgi:hypothetical protein
MADAIVSFVVQEGTNSEADRPDSPNGTVVQYATENGIVFQTDNSNLLWYCDLPQELNITFQENPLPFETDTAITGELTLRDNIGAPNGAYYYCDVDVYGYDDGSTTAGAALGFDLYAEVDGGLVSGNHYTVVILKNKAFRLTTRIKFYANAGETFRLFATVQDGDFDSVYISGGICEVRRAYYID